MTTTRSWKKSGTASRSTNSHWATAGAIAPTAAVDGRLSRACVDALEDRRMFSTAYALLGDAGATLVKFDTATPGTIQNAVTISGLQDSESVAGIDFRPANGKLYALGIVNHPGSGADGRLYTINTGTGAATLVGAGPFSTALAEQTTVSPANYGFDFNPAVDRIRLTNAAEQNLRLNPDTGALVQFDTNLSDGNNATTETITGIAYDRNDNNPATATTLYGIDLNGDNLAVIGSVGGAPNSPNGGIVTEVGPLGITVTDSHINLDIAPDGTAFATLPTNDPTLANPRLYTINLATGAATAVGFVGNGGDAVVGFAVDVGALPHAPAATADSYAVTRPASLTVVAPGVLANDTDADGDAVTAVLATTTANGSLVLNPNGSFTYTPNPGFTGSDTFTYRATDGALQSAPATVTINVVPANLLAVGVVGAATLIKFNINTPGVILDTVFVQGLQPGEKLVGIDYRPANSKLYGLGTSGRVYAIDANTGATTAVVLTADPADLTSPYAGLVGTNFGVDFNPVPDRLRIHSDAEQNLRVDVDTGFVTTDAALNPGNPTITATAYTNPDVDPATGTTLYAVDSGNDSLYIVNPPNNGTLTAVGSLGTVDLTGNPGFDITQDGRAFLAGTFAIAGTPTTYLVGLSLTTGQVVQTLGTVGNGAQALSGFAITFENKAPTAAADAYSITAGQTLAVAAPGVLGNDSDPEGSTLQASLVAGPASGTLGFNSDGSFSYAPATGFTGTATFTYRAVDATGNPSLPATVTITVNAAPPPALPVVSLGANQTITEGNSGTKNVTFTVSLSAPSTSAVTVKYSTGDLSATKGSDYVEKFGKLTFAAGQTTKTVTIQVKGDKTKEANELFKFVLYDAVGATEGDGYATVTIKNDD